jgi:hypothetical protein
MPESLESADSTHTKGPSPGVYDKYNPDLFAERLKLLRLSEKARQVDMERRNGERILVLIAAVMLSLIVAALAYYSIVQGLKGYSVAGLAAILGASAALISAIYATITNERGKRTKRIEQEYIVESYLDELHRSWLRQDALAAKNTELREAMKINEELQAELLRQIQLRNGAERKGESSDD